VLCFVVARGRAMERTRVRPRAWKLPHVGPLRVGGTTGAVRTVPRWAVSSGGDDGLRQWGLPSAQDTGTQVRMDALARRLAEAARSLQRQTSPQQVMDGVVRLAREMVPGADEATITMVRKDRHCYSAAATSELASDFDVLQDETGEGPCLDAIWQQETVRVDDLNSDPRWPVLGPRAAERGIHSMLCLQLFVVRDTLGALDLLARATSAFTDESEHVGLLLASHAAIAAADAHHFEHVTSALVNRDVIGQAKGILMERFKITSDQAFAVLARVSQDTNRKLSAIAEDLARTGMWTPGLGPGHDRKETP
jgi:GAF domain-containing protein